MAAARTCRKGGTPAAPGSLCRLGCRQAGIGPRDDGALQPVALSRRGLWPTGRDQPDHGLARLAGVRLDTETIELSSGAALSDQA